MSKIDFLGIHKEAMDINGFWNESYKSVVIKSIELTYKSEVIREWCISDILMNGDKFLIKWEKRIIPLTDEQLKEKYGREQES
jgi:hypothetical protein